MQSRGVRNPGRWAVICLIVAAASVIAIWTGAREMTALGYETSSTAARIGFGLFLLIMSLAMAVNFIWGHRVVQGLRSGRTKFHAWRVTPADYDRFREIDGNFAARGEENDYRPLRITPTEGAEVAFSRDGVLIGDRYFGLASTGLQRFHSAAMIRSDPPMLEFGIVTPSAGRAGFRRILSILRVPVASDGVRQAETVLAHYQAVLRNEVIVHPNFWKVRIRIGLICAFVSGACAVLGFLLRDMNQELHEAPAILAVAGTILGIGGLILALGAWSNDRSRRPRRR